MTGDRRLVAVVLVLALGLRLIALQSRALEYDDAFSVLLAGQSLSKVVDGTAADTMPPLYYFLLHIWMSISRALWFLRLLNVLLSVAVVALLYATVRRLFNPTSASWAALFAAVSPLHIFHAQGMRMYVALSLFLLGYFYCFLLVREGWQREERRWWAWGGLVVSGALAMYTHNLAIFSLVVPHLFLLLRRRWRPLGELVLAQLGIVILAAPWLVLVPRQFEKVQSAFWTPRPGTLEVVQMLVSFHTHLPVPDVLLPLAVIVSVVVFVFALYLTAKTGARLPAVQLSLIALFLPPLLLFIVSYAVRPVFLPRPVMFSSLIYYALLGRAVNGVRPRAVGLFLAGITVLMAILVLPAHYQDRSFPRSPFRQAVQALQAQAGPGDVIVHDNKLSFFPAHLHAPGLPQVFLPDPTGSHNDTLAPDTQAALGLHPVDSLPAAVAGRERVWFVVFDRALREHAALHESEYPELGWLREHFRMEDRQNFGDLHVYSFIDGL